MKKKCIISLSRMRNPFPSASNFCSKSRIYRQLDARTTQCWQSYNLRIFGIDFFHRPPYIVLAVVSENLSTLPFYLFFANSNKSLQLRKLLLFSGKQIHYSQSLPSSALGISHLMFSRFVVLKTHPQAHLFNPPRCDLGAAVTGLFFLPERAGADSSWFSAAFGRHAWPK